MCEKVPDFAQFTLEDYKLYYCMSISRTFGVNNGSDVVMCPFADMLNH